MKKISAVILLVLLLTACQTTTPAPTPTNMPAPTATVMQLPISTPTEKETALSSPSPTAVPPAVVLDYFPLSAGAIWKYYAEISYEDPNHSTQLATWSGLITDEVIDQITTPDGRVIFRLQEELEPIPPKEVWRQPGTLEYTVSGNGIFAHDLKIFQWPLADSLSWTAFADLDYVVNVSFVGTVVTPFSELTDCYMISLATNPDTTMDTFCPGIGFVEHSYRHNGSAQNEHYVLVSFVPGP